MPFVEGHERRWFIDALTPQQTESISMDKRLFAHIVLQLTYHQSLRNRQLQPSFDDTAYAEAVNNGFETPPAVLRIFEQGWPHPTGA